MGELSVPETLENHEKRLSNLETDYRNLHQEISSLRTDLTLDIAQLKGGMKEVENTNMREAGATRDLLLKVLDHSFGLDNRKLSARTKVILAFFAILTGSGGLFYVIVHIADELIK